MAIQTDACWETTFADEGWNGWDVEPTLILELLNILKLAYCAYHIHKNIDTFQVPSIVANGLRHHLTRC